MGNHKWAYRIYCEEGLSIRLKTPRRKWACLYRVGRRETSGPNEIRAMGFMPDRLFDGRPFRILTAVDIHTREAFALVPRVSFRAYRVIDELDRLAKWRGRPLSLPVDNGPECAARVRDQRVYLNGVEIDFSRPGKPTDDAFIEAFNGRFQTECLNACWFLPLVEARYRIEEWRCDYNDDRPHVVLGGLTPTAFATQAQSARKIA
jgi:putative transposase